MFAARKCRIFAFALACLLLFLSSPGAGQAQQRTRRLVLKDGSYQPAVRWEVKGNRVRYYSAERFEWEELPVSLVDWPATEKYAKDSENQAVVESQASSAEDEAERRAEAEKSPTVAPGVKLSDGGGVYLLDTFAARPELIEVVQNGAELNKNVGRNILRAAINPVASSRMSIELKGPHARVQSHELRPAIFIDVLQSDNSGLPADAAAPPSEPAAPTPPLDQRFRIVRVKKNRKGDRVVGNFKIAVYGRVSHEQEWVPAATEVVTREWVKVTPNAPLAPGEYALVEMLDKKQINLYVWDFGVDPNAPRNPASWVAAQPKATQSGTTESPVLQTRPQ